MFSFISIIILIGVNYWLRSSYEHKFEGSNSGFLMASQLTKCCISVAYAQTLLEQIQEVNQHLGGVNIISFLHDIGQTGIVIWFLFILIAAIVVTYLTCYILYSLFKNNFNFEKDIITIKTNSYISSAIICSIIIMSIILFKKLNGINVPPLGIIISIVELGIAGYFEYKFIQALDSSVSNKRISLHDRMNQLLQNTTTEEEKQVEKPKKYCPECGEHIDATLETCPACGEKTNF